MTKTNQFAPKLKDPNSYLFLNEKRLADSADRFQDRVDRNTIQSLNWIKWAGVEARPCFEGFVLISSIESYTRFSRFLELKMVSSLGVKSPHLTG